MRKGQYQLILGIIVLASVVASISLIYYFSFKPKIGINQTTSTTTKLTTTSTIMTSSSSSIFSSTTSSIVSTTSTAMTTTSTTTTTSSTTTTTINPMISFPHVTILQDVFSDMLTNPSTYVDSVATDQANIATQAKQRGYTVFGTVGGGVVCYWWPGSWQAVADQFVKPHAIFSDVIEFDEFQYSSDYCSKGYNGTIFNMLRDVARSVNPNILVGIVEPNSSYLEETFSTGGKPDFAYGEEYGEVAAYNYLQQQLAINRGGNLKNIGMFFSDLSSPSELAKIYTNGDSLVALPLTQSSGFQNLWNWSSTKTFIESSLPPK